MTNYLSPTMLEARIKEKPLSTEDVLTFLKDKVTLVHNNYKSKSAHIVKDSNNKYSITIGNLYDREEQEISLIHEATHGIYGAIGWLKELKIDDFAEIEDLVENEARRFYKENEDFVKEIYSKLIDLKIEPRNII